MFSELVLSVEIPIATISSSFISTKIQAIQVLPIKFLWSNREFSNTCKTLRDRKVKSLFSVNKFVYKSNKKVEKVYENPKVETVKPNDSVYDYFQNRGISQETVDKCGVMMTQKGLISYEYFNSENKLTFRKIQEHKEKRYCPRRKTNRFCI